MDSKDVTVLNESTEVSTNLSGDILSPFVSVSPHKGGKKVNAKLERTLEELRPLIRFDDVAEIYNRANTCEMEEVIDYLKSTIPDVDAYLAEMPEDSNAEDKLNAIRRRLKERAESLVPAYEMPAPDLGAEVDEARNKAEAPEMSRRIKAQYGSSPVVRAYDTGRSSVVSPYNTRRSPIKPKNKSGKSTRFLLV